MNTLIRCLRAAESFRRQLRRNIVDEDFGFEPMDFCGDLQAGRVAAWVMDTEVLEVVNFDLDAVSSCPGAFAYYDSGVRADITVPYASSTSDASHGRRRNRDWRRRRTRYWIVEREMCVDGYEADFD